MAKLLQSRSQKLKKRMSSTLSKTKAGIVGNIKKVGEARQKRVSQRQSLRQKKVDAKIALKQQRQTARDTRRSQRQKTVSETFKKFQEGAQKRQEGRRELIKQGIEQGGSVLKMGLLIPIILVGGAAFFLIKNPGVIEGLARATPAGRVLV